MRFIVLLLITLGLTACRTPATPTSESALQIDIAIEPDPPVVGEAVLVIRVRTPEGVAVTDASLAIRGDMTHAGMVPVLREAATSDADARYEIPFEWTMAGDWFVEVTATRPDGTSATATFDYRVRGG